MWHAFPDFNAEVLSLYLAQASALPGDPLIPSCPFPQLAPCGWPPFIPGSELSLLNSFDLGLETKPPAIPVAALLGSACLSQNPRAARSCYGLPWHLL